jgi:hypothetical protein
VAKIGEIVMPGQAAQQGHAALQVVSRSPTGRASSRSTIIGIGVAGVLLTVAAIGGVVMMSGSASAPVTTQVAAVSAPSVVAQAPGVAPAAVPVASVQTIAPAPYAPPAFSPDPAETARSFAGVIPSPAPAPALKSPGQCQIGQRQQLAINISATLRKEVGNVVRIYSGSYVSPPILVTPSGQIVTFPAPPGSTDSARIIIEQKTGNGATFDNVEGITSEYAGRIDDYRDFVLLRWTTPRC